MIIVLLLMVMIGLMLSFLLLMWCFVEELVLWVLPGEAVVGPPYGRACPLRDPRPCSSSSAYQIGPQAQSGPNS
jgi:hypothetical protein